MFTFHATAPAPDVSRALLPPLIHDLPPVLGMLAGALAIVWIGCAVVITTASLLATALVLGLRVLVRGCTSYLRHRREPACTQRTSVGDGQAATVTDLDQYRHHRTSSNPAVDATGPHGPDDEPA